MNALAIAANNSLNALLAMSIAPRPAQAPAGFVNLLDSFQAPQTSSFTSTSSLDSQKIADSLIRSMISTAARPRSNDLSLTAKTTATVNPAVAGQLTARLGSAVSRTGIASTNRISGVPSKPGQSQTLISGLPQIPVAQLFVPGDLPKAANAPRPPISASSANTQVPESTPSPTVDHSSQSRLASVLQTPPVSHASLVISEAGAFLPQAHARSSATGTSFNTGWLPPVSKSPTLPALVAHDVLPLPITSPSTRSSQMGGQLENSAAAQIAPSSNRENPAFQIAFSAPSTPQTTDQPVREQQLQPLPTVPTREDVPLPDAPSSPRMPSMPTSFFGRRPPQRASEPRPQATVSAPVSADLTDTLTIVVASRTEAPPQTTEQPLPQAAADVPMSFAALAPEITALPPVDTQKTSADPAKVLLPGAPIAFTARLSMLDNDSSPVVPPAPQTAAEEPAISNRPPSSAAIFFQNLNRSEPSADEKKNELTPQKAPTEKTHTDITPLNSREVNEIVRASTSSAVNAPAQIANSVAASPAVSTSEARDAAPRASEALLLESTPPTPAPISAPVQQITVRISPAGAAPVDLHVTERAGEIHVSVRTPDVGLQTSLRQDLGTLTNSLERAGYRADVCAPRETAAPAREMATQSSANPRDDGSETGSGGRGGYGNASNGRQQQQSRQQPQSHWLEELENSK